MNTPHPAGFRAVIKNEIFRRIFRNTAMLTGGKGLSAVLGLLYLALAAQVLGVYLFGVLILVHTYVVVMREITSFHTAQCVIRYGAACLATGEVKKLQGLLKFTSLLDILCSICGAVIAVVAIGHVAHLFELEAEIIPYARYYCLLIVFNVQSSSTGLLRLVNRFDVLARLLLVVPVVRLAGVCIAWFLDAGLVFFLGVWFLAGISRSLATVACAAWIFIGKQMAHGWDWSVRNTRSDHPGIWKFALLTNVHTSLKLINSHVITLVVGAVLGPAGAGLFKIAMECSKVLSKPAQLFTETIYPELAKLVSNAEHDKIWKIILQSGFVGLFVSVVVLCIITLFGKPLLGLIFGEEFIPAFTVLLLLMIAAAVTTVTFALDPAMYALGRPDISTRAEIISSLVNFTASIILLVQIGLAGAGIAGIIAALLLASFMYLCARRLLHGVMV